MIDLLSSRPMTKKALAEAARTTTREVELQINAARLEGAPILSDADGYRISHDPQEVRACAERLRSRALTQLATAAALLDTAERLESPLTFWEAA